MTDEDVFVPEGRFFPDLDLGKIGNGGREDLARLVRNLIDRSQLGILATVDEGNIPRARWMASLAADEFPWVYTLSEASSRKLKQIESHPTVSWVFGNADLSVVVSLVGEARIIRDVEEVKRIWKLVRSKERSYFLKHGLAGMGFVAIATRVLEVECCTPKDSKTFRVDVEAMG